MKTLDELLSHLRSLDVKLWVDGHKLRYSAPKEILKPALRNQLREHKAEIMKLLGKTNLASHSTSEPIQVIPRDENLSLSFSQEGFWFIDQMEGTSATYNLFSAIKFIGSLNIVALEQSLQEIVRRHEVLRTNFKNVNGQPTQVISPSLHLTVPVIDLCMLPETEQYAEVMCLASEEAQQPFDLSQDTLLRAKLLQLKNTEHILLFSIHHIVTDAGSVIVFLRELKTLYEAFCNNKLSPLFDLPIQYADFAFWQKQCLQAGMLEKQMRYWKQQLDGANSLLSLPTDRSRPPIQTFQGERQELVLSNNLIEALKFLSKESKVTLYMTMLGAFNTLLYRYTGQEDILIGSPFFGRNRAEIEGVMGPFLNMLVMRTDLSENPSFRELLKRVQKTCLEAYANSDLPFEELVKELKITRDPSYSPLYQVMFIFQVFPELDKDNLYKFSDLTLDILPIHKKGSLYDLTLMIRKIHHNYKVILEYNTDLFDSTTANRILQHFQILLEGIVTNVDQSLNNLPLLTLAEQHQLLTQWNQTQADYPKDVCIHQLFEAQVEKTPNAVAVVFENQQLTYQQLNQRANQLAHHLQSLGVQSEVLVGICLERSLEMLVGLLGILKAGGAYVPLDPNYPQERLAFMLTDAQVAVVLTQEKLLTVLPKHQAQVVCLDADWEEIAKQSQNHLISKLTHENLAYTIYTSGSTGKPKGVQIPHCAVVNFLQSMAQEPGLTASDTLLAVTSISFDIAALELYLPLITGARLQLASREVATDPKQLMEQLKASSATVMQATPATWRMLLTANWQGNPHLKMLCGGEALPQDLAEQLLNKGATLWNLYGPTETTIWSATYRVEATQLSRGIIPIGRPIANTKIYLLDSGGQPVPVGIPGELHIGGAGLARGYLNRPELTAEKFITNAAGERLYKSGDLARYLPDGNIEYIERLDHQVKIRGFRIELGEIGAVLSQHPAVVQAVVIAREDEPGNKRLVAYIVTCEQSLNINQLREFLFSKLPEYMVPSAFVTLETLPLTPNGKVDRKALPAPDGDFSREHEYVAPRTPSEEIIANIFASVLGVQNVGIHDNFFALGGHSLLTTQVISRVSEAFQMKLPLRSLFEKPTVALLSDRIETMRLALTQASPPPIAVGKGRKEIEL
ncbi:MAG: amino acid adenylation domain-containing protein [Moorea sp. SIO2I5]|nr:amino acid adenylation domain-containing protein [Moorena sp. SIO2I5]